MKAEEFHFLFRDSEGVVTAPVWRRWTLVLSGLCVAAALLWVLLEPWTQRDLSTQSLFDLRAFAAFVYLLLFTLVLIVTQISQMNLTAKRLRACALNPGWAAAWPASAFIAAASFWAEPNFFGMVPAFAPRLLLLGAIAVFAGLFYRLGREQA